MIIVHDLYKQFGSNKTYGYSQAMTALFGRAIYIDTLEKANAVNGIGNRSIAVFIYQVALGQEPDSLVALRVEVNNMNK